MSDAARELRLVMDVPPDGTEPAWALLPVKAGVVVFEAPDGRTVLLGTTADLRGFARARLGAEHAPAANAGEPPPLRTAGSKADLRAITGRVLAATVGSAMEADLLYLRLTWERLPATHRAATEQWVGWFLRIDPQDKFPKWEKVATTELDASVPVGVLLRGPMAEKHAAGRMIEALDDLFDLCRYHHLLVQSPHASACAYKEMGKCPAPCDGSETLESYRARVARAAAFAADPSAGLSEARARMNQAAAGQRFEEAARIKRWIDRAAEATGGPCRWLSALESLALVVVGRSEKPGWARLLAARGGVMVPVCDVPGDGEMADAAQACAAALERAGTVEWSREHADTLGLLSRWLYAPGKPMVEFVRARWEREGVVVWAAELREAAARVLMPRSRRAPRGAAAPPADDPGGFQEHAIESMEMPS